MRNQGHIKDWIYGVGGDIPHPKKCVATKDNIYIDMQAGINLEVLRKCANSTISVVRMAFYPLDCC